jgi:MYXO-CTERM domain-containing protein
MPLRHAALCALLIAPGIASGEVPAAGLDAQQLPEISVQRDGAQLMAHGFRAGPYAGAPEQVARSFLAEHGPAMGLVDDALQLERVLSAHGGRIVRLRRHIDGVPVLGATASVWVGDDGVVTMVRASRLEPARVDTQPGLDASVATALALEAAALEGPLHGQPQPRLVILPRGGHSLLAWQVDLSTALPVRSVRVSVDAHSGAVLSVADRRRGALGSVWDQSPLDGDTIEVELLDLTGDQDAMTGSQVKVQSVAFEGGAQIETQLAVPDEAGDFLYEPDEDAADDPFAEVHTYFHLSTLRRFFADTQQHEFDGTLQAYVNYREDAGGTYDNAYFTQDMFGNDMLVFGQGSVGDFCYDTDIIAHEHGHAIIEARTAFPQDFIVYDDYGWNNAIGGIHEGVADFWAGSYQGDSMVGEYIPVRDMDNDTTCPADLTGESHDDGEIVGGAAWDMAQIVGMDAAEIIVYDALGMLSDSPTFAELAEMCIAVAWELADEGELEAGAVEAVEASMEERGMLRCGRALELAIDEPAVVQVNLIMGLTEIPDSFCELAREGGFAFTMPFQLAFTTPPASEGPVEQIVLGFSMDRLDHGEIDDDTLEYSFLVRKDQLVTFDMESVNTGMGFELDVPNPLDYDLAFEESPRSITLDSETIELASDTTYYLAMRHMNCAAVDMTISTQLTLGELPDDSGPDDTGESEPEGCGGCSTGSASGGHLALLGLLALVGVARRRRG